MSWSRPLGSLDKPQWFIRNEGTTLKVNESVLSELSALRKHIVVVAAVGPLRTGKSWILDQLADCNVQEGFKVDDGQTAVTNGIWILCREHPQKQDCVVVFLDTEGLHDPYKNDTANDDNRHFILAFLLSDIFIFNAMHKFDNNDLEKIGFITMISKKLQRADAQKSFPEFLLLLRDVSQVKLKGTPVNPDEYLEDVLKSCEDEFDRNSPKWYIREYCSRRTCFKLSQPVEFDDLADLGRMEQPSLRNSFVDDVQKLKDHVYKDSGIKRFINNSPYTTSAFCAYATVLIENVKDGVIPKVSSLQQRIAADENKRTWDAATEYFKIAMRDEEKNNVYENLSEKFTAVQRQGMELIDHHLVPMRHEHKSEVMEKFKKFSEDEYLKVSAEKCHGVAMGLLEPHFKMIDDNSYKAPKAKQTFEADVRKIKEKYDNMRYLGPEKTNIWTDIQSHINRKYKELELVDLLHATSMANKEERKRHEEMIIQMKNNTEEQILRIKRRNAREVDWAHIVGCGLQVVGTVATVALQVFGKK